MKLFVAKSPKLNPFFVFVGVWGNNIRHTVTLFSFGKLDAKLHMDLPARKLILFELLKLRSRKIK